MDPKKRLFEAFAGRPRPLESEVLRPEVKYDGERTRELLATRTSEELSVHEIRTVLEGNLWMLAPVAFLYHLPAFLHSAIDAYRTLSVFVSELVGALTMPDRADVVESLDRLAQVPAGFGLPKETTELLRTQQLELYDSGTPLAIFRSRFDDLTEDEGGAVLAFFDALRAAHGDDFPFDELETAIDRHWGRYRAA